MNDGVIGGAGEFAKDDEKQLVITSQTKPQAKNLSARVYWNDI